MSKDYIIRNNKKELVWKENSYDYDETDFDRLKKEVKQIIDDSDYRWNKDFSIALYNLIKDLTWEEVAKDFEKWMNGAWMMNMNENPNLLYIKWVAKGIECKRPLASYMQEVIDEVTYVYGEVEFGDSLDCEGALEVVIVEDED